MTKKAVNLSLKTLLVLILTIIIISVLFMIAKDRFYRITGQEPQGNVFYYYPESKSFENPEIATSDKTLVFSKSGKKVSVNNELSLYFEECDAIDTSGEISEKKIVIDVGNGYNDGLEGELKESEEVRKIASALDVIQKGLIFTRPLDRDLGEELTIEKRKKSFENADLIISIHASKSGDKTSNEIKAYIHPESEKKKESEKLACLLTQALKAKFKGKITDVKIEESIEGENEILVKEIPSVRIELGNIDADKNLRTIDKTNDNAKAIAEAINEYFKKEKPKDKKQEGK